MLTRRDLLGRALMGATVVSLYGGVGPVMARAAERLVPQPRHSDQRRRLLVVVNFGGGNDGLNTVVPYADDAYYRVRPTLAIKREKVLRLDDHIGLHPALRPLRELYDDGQIAVVQGVGYPKPSYSHFQSSDIWMTGDVRYPSPFGGGWLARATLSGATDPASFAAVGLGARTLPLGLLAPTLVAPAVASFESYKVQTDEDTRFDAGLERDILYGASRMRQDGEPATVEAARAVMRGALSGVDALQKGVDRYQGGVSYPATDLGRKLAMAAKLIAADLGTRIIHVGFGGFDTHSGQASPHEQLLAQFAKAIPPFLEDLRAQHRADDTLIITMSEFGRRVAENGSQGTDHGTAAPLFVIGSAINGGIFGAHPSLTDLYENRDLKFTTDFRSVYAAVLDSWLGVPSETILGGKFEPVRFLGRADSRATDSRRTREDDGDGNTVPKTSVRQVF